MISEQLRVTLLSLKQISDRLKLLNTTSVTKSEALAYKNEIIAALEDIDFTEITEALDSIDDKIDDISTELEDVAQEATLTLGILDIRDDISNIDTSDLAKEASVKDGNDTAISVSKSVYGALTDSTNGLSAIKNAIPTVANIQNGLATSSALSSVATDASNAATDAAAAKTAAQNAETTAQATANKNEIIAQIQANAGIPILTIPDSTTVQELTPNVLYIFDNRMSTLTLTLGTPIVGIVNEYHFFVVCGSTAPTINFPTGITWNGGNAPTIAADKTYEVSILNNIAAYFEI